MQAATQVRKRLVEALNKRIIPLLQNQALTQVLAKPGGNLFGVEHWTVQKAPLPNISHNPLDVKVYLGKTGLCSRRIALLGIAYSGASHESVGLTCEMAQEFREQRLPVPPGVTTFQLRSPGMIYVPQNIPHAGFPLPEVEYGPSRMLLTWFTDQQVWVCLYDAMQGCTYALSIIDPACKRLEKEYVHSLEQGDFWAAQSVVLDIMNRVAADLARRSPELRNGAWPSFGPGAILLAPSTPARYVQHCYKVIDYIQFNIDTPLTLEVLAQICGITASHLSYLFHKSTGIPLMHFITMRRLRAAEMMLRDTSERIGDIARIVGFASSHSFNGAFRRSHGMSPSQYRRLMQQ